MGNSSERPAGVPTRPAARVDGIKADDGNPCGGTRLAISWERGASEDTRTRLLDFLDVSSDWFWETDAAFRFTFISERVRDITGFAPEIGLGKTRWDLAGVDALGKGFWRAHRADLEAHRPFRDFRYTFRGPDGRVRHWKISGKPIYNKDGRFTGYRGTGTDETAEVAARRRAESAEALLRGITDNLPGIVFRCVRSADGTIAMPYFGADSLARLGIDAEEIMGNAERLLDVIAPEDREPCLEAVRRSMTSLDRLDMEFRIVAPSGAHKWMRAIAQPRRHASGDVVWDGIALDISHEKRAGEALRAVETRLHVILDHAPAMIYLKDRDGRYTLINRAFETTYDVRNEDVVGKTVEQVFEGIDTRAFTDTDRAVLDTAAAVQNEIADPCDSTGRILHVVKFPVTDATGRIVAIGAVETDITAIRRTERMARRKDRQTRIQNEALLALAKSGTLAEGDLRGALREITETAAHILDIARVGVWLFDEDRARITCRDLFLSDSGVHEQGATLACRDFPDYFAALERDRTLAAANARDDARTCALAAAYLAPHDITSVLDVPIRAGGIVVGVARHEHVGEPRDWSPEERHFAGAIGDLVVQALQADQRNQAIAALKDSEAKFRAIVDNTPHPMMLKDPDGRFLLANARYCKVFGVTAEAIRGKTNADLFDEEEYERYRAHDRKVLETGEAVDEEFEISTVIGKRVLIATKFPIRNDRGEIEGVGFLGTDFTARKEAEEAQRRSEARMRDFADVASDWFWEMDEALRFSYFSERLHVVSGLDPEILLGKTRRDFADPGSAIDEDWETHYATLDAREPFRDFRYKFGHADGRTRYFSISGKPVFDETGAFRGYRGTGTDITLRVQAENAQRDAKEQAEFANRAKSEFLANMSHELRTPLNAVIGFSEIIMNEIVGPIGSPRYLEYARDIHDSGSHLLSLINDILDLSKVEAGKFEIEEQWITVAEIVAEAMTIAQTRAEAGALTLAVDIPDDLPALQGDRRAFKQILINLLTNAIKFTPRGGQVTVSARLAETGGLEIAVTDTGIGIAEKDLPTALASFGQIDGAYTRKHQGTGLGLPLVKSLAEIHGGRLEIESAPGAGTTMRVHLPAERVRRD